METNEKPTYAAPDVMAPMSVKKTQAFGASYARHMWANYWANGPMLGLRKYNRYIYLREVARGGMNLESVKSYLNLASKDGDDEDGFVYYDLGVLNFVTAIIRKMKNELRKIRYDISVEAIDPLSLSEKKQFEDNARLAMVLKGVIEAYGKSYQDLLPEFPEGFKPASTQELEVFLQANNYKIHDEIKAELSVNSDLKWENWDEVANLMADDWIDLGAAFCRVYRDHNGRRRVRYVPLERFICSTPEDESCTNLQYGGEVRYISVEQFVTESSGYYDTETQKKIIEQCASYNSYGKYDPIPHWTGAYNDAVKRIPILDFEYSCPDKKTWVRSVDKKGRVHWDERADDYEVGWFRNPKGEKQFDAKRYDEENRKIQTGEKQVVRDDRVSVYGGSWVIGTDYCYNYDLLESDKYVSIGYVGFAPELRNGETTSTVESLLEPAGMIQIMHNKMKEAFGQGWTGFLTVDHSKLVDIALGKEGAGWTPRKVMEFLLQKKVLVHNTELQGNAGTAFGRQDSGITMEDYSRTLWDAVTQMTAITGVDPRAETGTNISAESLKVKNQATMDALGFLSHSYQQVYGNVGKLLLRFTPEFAGNWAYMRQFIVGALKATTNDEWMELKARINKYASVPLEQGGLTASDEAILDNIDNLKLAQFVLAYFVRRNMEQAAAMKKADMELQGQLNEQAAKVTSDMKMAEINAEAEANIRLETAKHGFKMQQISLENQGRFVERQVQMQGMYDIAHQQGSDSITKEAQRAQNNREVTELKNANDRLIESAGMYHDHSKNERDKEHEHEMAERGEAHEKEITAIQAKQKAKDKPKSK